MKPFIKDKEKDWKEKDGKEKEWKEKEKEKEKEKDKEKEKEKEKDKEKEKEHKEVFKEKDKEHFMEKVQKDQDAALFADGTAAPPLSDPHVAAHIASLSQRITAIENAIGVARAFIGRDDRPAVSGNPNDEPPKK